MSRLVIKDVGIGMPIHNRRTGERGSVMSTSTPIDAPHSVRVRLADGRRITVRADESGEIRWERDRQKASQ